MKKLVFIISFSLMILATLLLAGCGSQNAFAGQASVARAQSGGSGFRCSEGTACGFVDQNTLSNYIDRRQFNVLTQEFVTTTKLQNQLNGISMDCTVFSLSGSSRFANGDDLCIGVNYPICVQMQSINETIYYGSTNHQCLGVQWMLNSHSVVDCGMNILSSYGGRSYSCQTNNYGVEPFAGDVASRSAITGVTCCRIAS